MKKFSSIAKRTFTKVQEAQRVSYRINSRSNMLRNIKIKCAKVKDGENFKTIREKAINNMQGNTHRTISCFYKTALHLSSHSFFACKVMNGKNPQPRILYPERLPLIFDGEIKSFIDKQKLKEFRTTNPALQKFYRNFYRHRRKDYN